MGTTTQRTVPSAGRVLVVDDDAAVRLVCAINLQAEGLHVIEAADGNDALDQMAVHVPISCSRT